MPISNRYPRLKPIARRFVKLLLLLAGGTLLVSMLISLVFAFGEADGYGRAIVIAEMLVLGYAALAISGIFRQTVVRPIHHKRPMTPQEAFHQSPSGLAFGTLSGRFIKVNPAFCSITGYTSDELENLTFQEITHPDDLAIDVAHLNELLSNARTSYQIQKRYIQKNGSPVEIYLWVSLVRDPSDQPLYLIGQMDRADAVDKAPQEIFPFDRYPLLHHSPEQDKGLKLDVIDFDPQLAVN